MKKSKINFLCLLNILNFIIILFLLFAFNISFSQIPDCQWAVKSGMSKSSWGEGVAITNDVLGNVYVTGDFSGTATIGSTTLTCAGTRDIFIAKYNNAGIPQWAIKEGGASLDIGKGIFTDASGNVYVTGSSQGSITFCTKNLTTVVDGDFIAKYNNAGILQWVIKPGVSKGSIIIGSLTNDASGNIYVVGNYYDDAIFGSTSLSKSSGDIFIAKYNSSGICQWAIKAGKKQDNSLKIAVDYNGNIFITGYFANESVFESQTLTSSGYGDIFLAKYNSSGKLQWVNKAGGSAEDAPSGIKVDASGNVYITGNYNGPAAFGSEILTSNTIYADVFIAKYSNEGSCLWAVKSGGDGNDFARDIILDDTGNIYITGYFDSKKAIFGSTILNNSHLGSEDIFIAKYNKDGITQWAEKAGGNMFDQGNGITIDLSGNVFITGYFQTSASFGFINLSSAGYADAFVAKYGSSSSTPTSPIAIGGSRCGTGTVTLNASGAGSGEDYKWYADTISVTPLQTNGGSFTTPSLSSTKTYYVTKYDKNSSVESTPRTKVIAKINPIPIINAIPDQTICIGMTASLTTFGGDTYLWSTGGTTATINVSPTNTTTYTVIITKGNCTASSNVVVSVNSPITVNATASPSVICAGENSVLTATGGSSYIWSTGGSTASITVSPTITTTYKVTGKSSECTGMVSVIVTVNPKFTVNVGSYQTICKGSSTTLTATGGTTYSWSTGSSTSSITVSPNVTTTYYVTATTGSCSAKDTVVVNVTSAVNLTNGLVAYYPFNGNANDMSGNGNNGTANGATLSTDRFGNTNSAYSFNGTDNYIEVPSTNLMNDIPLTISLWFKPEKRTDMSYAYPNNIISNDKPGYGGYGLGGNFYDTTGQLTVEYHNSFKRYSYLLSNKWYNIILIYESGLFNIYINGILYNSTSYYQQLSDGLNHILFGKHNDDSNYGTTRFFKGSIDDIKIYNRALNECEVNALYTETPCNLKANAGADQSICKGGSATLTATGGTAYSWSTGASTSSVTVAPTVNTTYYVTVTTGSCSAKDTVVVNVNNPPIVTASSIPACIGNVIQLTANGAMSYSWSNSQTVATISVTPSITTTYTVTGTTNGCTGTAIATATIYQLPTITANSVSICNGSTTNLTATGGKSYSWNTGCTNATCNVSPSITSTYIVTGTDAGGCKNTASATVTVNTVTANAGVDQTICKGSSATLIATGGTTYRWSNGSTTASITVSPTTTTTFTVTATTGSCTASDNVVVTMNSLPTILVNNATICSGGTATLTASGGTTYSWSNGTTGATASIAPTVTTTYRVTGTTGTCSGTALATVTVGANPTITVNNATICSGSSATLTAQGGTTYSWSNGTTGATASIAPTVTTTYMVTGTTGTCSGTALATVTVVVNPTITVNNATICSGSSATLTAQGGTTYSWSNGATGATASIAPTVTTTYKVTGTTGTCSGTALATVTVGANPTITVNNATICSGGTATLTASGGTTYSWSNGTTGATASIAPTVTTTYRVTGTTGTCSGTALATVTVIPTPAINATASPSSVCSGSSATLTAQGGTTYQWTIDNGQLIMGQSVSVNPTATSTYTVTGTSNGCSGTASVVVTVNNSITVNATASPASVCSGIGVTLSATGGTTYQWTIDNGQLTMGQSVPVYPTATSTYTVTGTSNGCSGTALVVVTVIPSIKIVSTANPASICPGSSSTLYATGGTTYSWSNGSTGATASIAPTVTTTYMVTGNSAGCTGTGSVIVTVNALPASPSITNSSRCGRGTVDLSASGAGTNEDYKWYNTASGGTLLQTGGSTFTTPFIVAATDFYVTKYNTTTGCESSPATKISAIINLAPKIDAGTYQTICSGSSVILTATGGISYSWSTGGVGTSIVANPTTTTTYIVTGTGTNCSAKASVIVVVNPIPVANAGTDKTINSGYNIVLTATGGDSYQWSSGEATQQITVSPTTTTTYDVSASQSGCTASDRVVVTVNSPIVASAGNDLTICLLDTPRLTATGGAYYRWSTGSRMQSIVVNPTSTTTYKVTATSATGITSTASVKITVISVDVNVGADKVICKGMSVTITATGNADKYKWNIGDTTKSITVTPLALKLYVVKASSISVKTCTATDVAVVRITNPPVANGHTRKTICNGSSVQLSVLKALKGDVWNWSTGATTRSITVSPAVNTTYTVTIRNSVGCIATDDYSVTVSGCKKNDEAEVIREINNERINSLSIYPNPFSGTTTISYSLVRASNIEINLYNIIGNKVKSILNENKIKGNYTLNWDKKDLSPGVYFIELKTGENKVLKKMVIL